jgi:hypothetical protein
LAAFQIGSAGDEITGQAARGVSDGSPKAKNPAKTRISAEVGQSGSTGSLAAFTSLLYITALLESTP